MSTGMSLPPGFRFHPTDEELVGYYLKKKVDGQEIELEVIPVIDLYKFDPWELPEKSFLLNRDMEWYFFAPYGRKYPNGSRTNRATGAGYWKATGKDKKINCHSSVTGLRKTLVFYCGRAPAGDRTDWVMHEYRLCEELSQGYSTFQGSFSLCRIVKRNEQGHKMGTLNGEAKVRSVASSSFSDVFTPRMSPSNMLQLSEENPSSETNLHGGSYYSTPITSFEIGRDMDLKAAPTDVDDMNLSDTQYLVLDTSKGFMETGNNASEYLVPNEFPNTLTSRQSYHNTLSSANSPCTNFAQEVDLAYGIAQMAPMSPHPKPINCFEMGNDENREFPSHEWAQSPYLDPQFDGFEAWTPAPQICRQTSWEGNFGEASNLWLLDDNLGVVI